METPLGLYYVTVRFKPVTQPFLGTFAFETSAYSKLSEWPGGGVVGLHGTTSPQLLGQAVSHGCIRLSNEAATFSGIASQSAHPFASSRAEAEASRGDRLQPVTRV
jgi:hypothetical protein